MTVSEDFENRLRAAADRARHAALAASVRSSRARVAHRDAVAASSDGAIQLFDAMVTDPQIRTASRRLFADAHYARAVEEAFKLINATVKARSGVASKDGADLMFHVFDVDNPVLKLNRLTSASGRDEQRGYRLVFAGVMSGVRNPRAHDPGLRDDPDPALEMLVLASHLMRVLAGATRVRKRSRRAAARP